MSFSASLRFINLKKNLEFQKDILLIDFHRFISSAFIYVCLHEVFAPLLPKLYKGQRRVFVPCNYNYKPLWARV